MDITIHASFLPHDDPDASVAFYRETLGFEIRNDVGTGKMRCWQEREFMSREQATSVATGFVLLASGHSV